MGIESTRTAYRAVRDPDYVRALQSFAAREAATRPDVVVHEENVTRTAVAIAIDLGMHSDDVDVLAVATRYHDVGKLAVPTEILRKPGRLTEGEWDRMRRHAIDGAAMLRSVPGIPDTMVEVARYHHERYDGFGYEGLRGEDIPFAARIVAIADVHDALCAERDYKPRMREDEVLVTMSSDAASPAFGRRAFDPVLLRRFVSMRLSDPTFECSKEVRSRLATYVASDPMEDLSVEARSTVGISRDGTRRIFEGGGPEVRCVAEVGKAGERREMAEPASTGPRFGS